ncbi:hypothetical protein PP175_08990 [Aneurinibacillus sp. Ricciae_BoGa-3]|uniref:hypothetical protein n=1 Tax=Aneurinibacillus sp. Ricciae_BoGa-3 TaxID=3022697 RepID=UPI00234255EE|nr:hypothetical protein [Aneurinibacillus sp. Ricciae_BoGa-3]WCK56023.1 hypothetical protein PP175_08990 [Aneurinibacillus sp. Ricciae_BoGa-3]
MKKVHKGFVIGLVTFVFLVVFMVHNEFHIADFPSLSSVFAQDGIGVLFEPTDMGKAHREVQKLLRSWAANIGRQNSALLLEATANLDSKTKEMIQNLAKAPVEVAGSRVSLKKAGQLKQNPTGNMLQNVQAEIQYRYKDGKQDEWYSLVRSFSFVQQGGQWKITAYQPVDSLAFFETGPTLEKKSQHFVYLYQAPNEQQIDRVIGETEKAYQEVGNILKLKGKPPYPVLLYPRESMWQGGPTVATASSQYYMDAAGYKVTNQYVSINMEALEKTADDHSFYTTLKHELVHVYQFPNLPPYVPVWLLEGMAMYYSSDDKSYLFRGSVGKQRLNEIVLSKLTASEQLGEAAYGVNSDKQQQEYAFSYCTVQYLVATYGETKFKAFVQSYSDTPWPEIADDIPADIHRGKQNKWEKITTKLTDKYVKQYFGLTEKQLEEKVKNHISQMDTES